jgi:cytochrome P450
MVSNSGVDYEDLLPHYDMWDPEHEKIKWDVLEYARRKCPVSHTDADGGGQYIVTRYQDVRRILEDPYTFSSKGVAPRPSPVGLNPLDSDPPYQPDLRKILNPLFTRTFLMKFEPELRKNAADLIDGFIGNGRFDFVQEFAGPFVGNALSRAVFNEEDPVRMAHAQDVVLRVAVEGTDEAYGELVALSVQYLAEQTENPNAANEVMNAISTGTVEGGRHLTEMERLGVVAVLFLGGLDTTRGALGSIAHQLAIHPELEKRVRDPAWIRQDMDELIRLVSPVGCLGRTATKDVEVGGLQIKAGEQILVRFDSANHDEAHFEDGSHLRFDLRRGGHVGFGLGLHRCLGAHFARIQIAIAFEELFRRITNLSLADPDTDVRWAAGIANGPEILLLAFDVVD